MSKQHKLGKGEVRIHGATFKLVETGKVVRNEKPQRKPREENDNGKSRQH